MIKTGTVKHKWIKMYTAVFLITKNATVQVRKNDKHYIRYLLKQKRKKDRTEVVTIVTE